MVKIEELGISNLEYKDEIIAESQKAMNYLSSFEWCNQILNGWLANGFGYILCIFYFEIAPAKNSNADEKVWVIVGDIPSAYLDTIEYKTANDALSFYCFLMEEWIGFAKQGKPADGCYPINVPPTLEYAEMLQIRVDLIKKDFLPCV
jgi:hypothetical protein